MYDFIIKLNYINKNKEILLLINNQTCFFLLFLKVLYALKLTFLPYEIK